MEDQDEREVLIEATANELIREAEKKFPTPPTKAEQRAMRKHMRKEERDGLRITAILKRLRKDPKARIPENVLEYVVKNATTQAMSTMQYLQFERNIASFKFRSTIRLSDRELETHIVKQQSTLVHLVREYETLLAWVVFMGILPDYEAFDIQLAAQAKEKELEQKAKERAVTASQIVDTARDIRKLEAKERFK
jgi:hypothetical protein